jgi:hypothetical protein
MGGAGWTTVEPKRKTNMPEIKLPPEVVAAFDTLEAGQSLDLANAFVREDGMLLATIKVHGRPSKLWTPAVVSPYTLTSQIRLGTIYKDRETGRAVQPVAVDYADGAFIYVEALDEHGDSRSGIIYGVEASDLLPFSEEEYWEQYDSPATCLEFSATCKASPAHPLKVLHASHPNLILELLDECKTDDEALCLVRQNPTLFRRRIQAINETVDKIKAILLSPTEI